MRRIANSRKEAKKLFENAYGEAWLARELEEVMILIIVDTNKWNRLDQMDRLK